MCPSGQGAGRPVPQGRTEQAKRSSRKGIQPAARAVRFPCAAATAACQPVCAPEGCATAEHAAEASWTPSVAHQHQPTATATSQTAPQPATTSSSSSSSNKTTNSLVACLRALYAKHDIDCSLDTLLAEAVTVALTVCASLSNAWPDGVFVTQVTNTACTTAVMQLCWLAMQYSSKQISWVADAYAEQPDPTGAGWCLAALAVCFPCFQVNHAPHCPL